MLLFPFLRSFSYVGVFAPAAALGATVPLPAALRLWGRRIAAVATRRLVLPGGLAPAFVPQPASAPRRPLRTPRRVRRPPDGRAVRRRGDRRVPGRRRALHRRPACAAALSRVDGVAPVDAASGRNVDGRAVEAEWFSVVLTAEALGTDAPGLVAAARAVPVNSSSSAATRPASPTYGSPTGCRCSGPDPGRDRGHPVPDEPARC